MSPVQTSKKGVAATIAGTLTLAGLALTRCREEEERPKQLKAEASREAITPEERRARAGTSQSLSEATLPPREELSAPLEENRNTEPEVTRDQYRLRFVDAEKTQVFGSAITIYIHKPGMIFDYRHVDEITWRQARNPRFDYGLPGGAKPQDYALLGRYKANELGEITFSFPETREPYDWTILVENSKAHVPFFIRNSDNRLLPSEKGKDGELIASELLVPDRSIKHRFFASWDFAKTDIEAFSDISEKFFLAISESRFGTSERLRYDPATEAFDFRGNPGFYNCSYHSISSNPEGKITFDTSCLQTFQVGIEGEHRYGADLIHPLTRDVPKPTLKKEYR